MDNLKQCPFCGCEANIRKISVPDGQVHYCDWIIKCNKCPAEMRIASDGYYGRKYYTEDEAILMWNKRIR